MRFTRAVIACLAIATIAQPQAGLAHAFLKTASPAAGSTVAVAPRTLVLQYTEEVEPTLSTVEVRDSAGGHVEDGPPRLQNGDETRLVVPLKPLAPGTYKVIWHATSTDAHKTQGSFSFTIKP